ncbi:MAG: sugar phosphate isomerase/epimerase family protein [Anaerolineae bacterium]|nr:sugar phosphate isomerase/epimerase [Anaerolineae bacterium]MDW8099210.1 sugar phosphate isomerase/epimerase family protein [Anaerolineae bacterium]
MRLGVAGEIIPRRLNAVSDQVAAKIAALGFSGVGTHFEGDPGGIPRAELQRVRAIFADHGVRIVQSWGWQQPLVHPDESVRRTAVCTLQHAIRVAADLGADMVMTGPGSLNPRGPWWPHPGNHTPATEDRLVQSLKEVMSACEVYGVPIALECHVTSPLDSAERVRRVIERVGSPWVKVNLDPVNFVRDLPTLFNTTGLLTELFDTLGPYILAAHIKDVYVEDRHVIHINETVPGEGVLDFDTFFRRFEALLPNGYAIVEHLPESLVPQAMAFVTSKLAALGIPIVR